MPKFIKTDFEFHQSESIKSLFINVDYISNFSAFENEKDKVILSSIIFSLNKSKIFGTVSKTLIEIENAIQAKNKIISIKNSKQEYFLLTDSIVCFGQNFIEENSFKNILILDSLNSVFYTNEKIEDIYNKIYS